ncbi:MAG: DEAD/DEAH box helicase [Flavobacteriales bacterium]|nr:DEAD/DEAH box helicase [Flavobacteriales bacterium]
MTAPNQNPEQKARDRIDQMLVDAGWVVQSKNEVNLAANLGVAVREYQTEVGPVDYALFVDRKPVGVIEAKKEDEGQKLTTVEEQSVGYASSKLKYLNNEPLPFVYESTGVLTRFTDYRDPKPRGRRVFSFHRPETMQEWMKQEQTLRGRLLDMPNLDLTGLRPAQIDAITKLEKSFKANRPKALIQMATGAGKTFTAATFIYRLLKFAKAKRILFLVDTRNLGEQAEQEFMKFQPTDDNRKFTELYNVQRLSSSYVATDSQVSISTIQRLYSILQGTEMDESAENENPNESSWMQQQVGNKEPLPVAYNEKVPIEMFDFIIIDECHRSIYNLWKQVLDYFDATLIGLTATPETRTLGFFDENLVSEYTYEQSVSDGVNVPFDTYTIETDISKNGAVVKAGWYVDRRDKLSRKKRWQREDEDTAYKKNDLDKAVVNPSQIRNIIREYRRALREEIFPGRIDKDGEYEVPKTLIFAKTDSHADDIIKMVREEFDEGNDFCKKVTYKADEDPKTVLNRFRNEYYPRIAVTVDMIATGTDVKPLEVLLFMRDVKSLGYFEQMKGRGTRTINTDDLKQVSATAAAKTHFVIVDAVGATKSKKTDSRPLERKRTVPMKDLLGAVTMGVNEEDLFLSLANRLIRLDRQLSEKEQAQLAEAAGGKTLKQISKELLNAFDPDAIDARRDLACSGDVACNVSTMDAQQQLAREAATSFNGKFNELVEKVRKQHEQIIDHHNIDTVIRSEWDKDATERAQGLIKDFKEYMEAHKDEIQALSIFYNQPYQRRTVTYKMVKEVLDILKTDRPLLAPFHVWDAYTQLEEVKSKRPEHELTALVSLIRRVCGIDDQLRGFDSTIDENFRNWIFKQNAGQHNRFSEEQMDWLRMLKDHLVNSFHIDVEDLDYTPFDAKGGRGRMWQLFGEDMNGIIEELNEVLVA